MKESTADLHRVLSLVALPAGMVEFRWNPWTESMLAGCRREDHNGVPGWGRLVSGFFGNILAEPEAGQSWAPMDGDDWIEFIAVLGRVLFAQQKIRSRI